MVQFDCEEPRPRGQCEIDGGVKGGEENTLGPLQKTITNAPVIDAMVPMILA